MTGGFPSGDRQSRRLRLRNDGELYDLDERRAVDLEELCDDVRSGRRFRAYRQHTGAECTNEVLVEILRMALPGYPYAAPDALPRPPHRAPPETAGPAGGSADGRSRPHRPGRGAGGGAGDGHKEKRGSWSGGFGNPA
ncbi:hypothetical protein Pve01_46460 [Planomonospora venezuelensis]|uniref:Uncharacterized protein n=1 Tax=Planomonospora venezuelensis TaxID=1999 RepID=A0A841DE89_PLAVE|nr:hypothetical protein [Planomonospora venezuelensis]GIN02988.1 hypothetical protein Pve01_46460 [Planomonospora venezuelensis]